MNKKTAVYAGTFDPITYGHIDIIERAIKIFDVVDIVIGLNPLKKTLFSLDERINLIQEVTHPYQNIKINHHEGLLVDYARQVGACALIRGIRAVSDFDYEFQMALMNRHLNPDVETILMMPKEEYCYLNSSIIREIAQYDAELKKYVPEIVIQKLREKLHLN